MLLISWACFRIAPAQARSLVPALAAGGQRAVQHRARQQRCAEDHGHHLAAADVARSRDAGSSAGLGDRQLLPGHLGRHAVRRLAHHPHHGPEADQADAGQRFGGLAGRRDHAVHRVALRHSGVDHAHDHRRHPRHRRGAESVAGALGSRHQPGLCVAADDSGLGAGCRGCLPGRAAASSTRRGSEHGGSGHSSTAQMARSSSASSGASISSCAMVRTRPSISSCFAPVCSAHSSSSAWSNTGTQSSMTL